MEQEILHEFALNEQGLLINAKNAQKGEKYICPGCKTEFILKKSGNIGKGSRRPHFAHNVLEGNCSHESYLHNTFKIKTLEYLNEIISKGLPLNINWKCNYCNNEHNLNLIGFSEAKVEFNMKECIPDIALFDRNGRIVMVIEIVYKHPPEDKVIKFYKNNKIILNQIIIYSEDDLINVENKIKNPSSVDLCIKPKITYNGLLTTNYRRNNGVPNDFIDNPEKYYSKNGKFYRKRRRF